MNIEDVAKLAGVSVTTVSRVINNIGTVKQDNKRRVLEAIEKLGYKPNVAAQRLAGARKNTIGLLIPPYKDLFGSFFVSEVLRGVGQEVSDLKMDLLVHISYDKSGEELAGLDILNPSFMGGVLFADIDGNQAIIDRVKKENIPFVIMNHYFKDEPVNCIAVDNIKGAVKAVDHLAKLGHRRIATITGRLDVQSGSWRLQGYKEGLAKNRIEIKDELIEEGDFTRESGYRAMKKLLSSKSRPSSVFVASDEMAQEAIRAVLEAGLKVPEDISIVGFDDNFLAVEGFVPLTTIRQPLVEMGKKAVNLLWQLMSGRIKPPAKQLLDTQLIERSSCKKI